MADPKDDKERAREGEDAAHEPDAPATGDAAAPDEASTPGEAEAAPEEEKAAPEEEKPAAGEGPGPALAVEKAPRAPSDIPWTLGLAVAIAVPALFFFVLPPLTKSGLWDPFELNVADLGRRLAVNLFHATGLALAGTDNSLPHLNDLGRPELPFTSIAVGFKLFGLHEWAGRAPLALWGLLGVVATYGWVSRLIDRRAGLYAALALTTMPLYFVQARTMLGDIVTMAAVSAAFGGLAVGAFDRTEEGARVTLGRVLWTALGAVALVAGYYSRGAILGVAVPCAGVGLAWAVTVGNGRRAGDDPLGHAVGALSLLAGAVAFYVGVQAVALGGTDLHVAAGAMIKAPAKYPTFDYFVGHLGPALAPWSAFAPFAIGRMFMTPVGRTGFALQRESYARVAILVGGAVALSAHAFLAARTDLIPFCAPALLAAACGVALRDYGRGAHPSVAMAVGVAMFLGIFHHDFHELPEKAYQAFGVASAPFPETFKNTHLLLWTVALVGFAAIGLLLLAEREPKREPFDPKGYLATVRSLREAWDGLLALGYFAMVAGASLAGLVIWMGLRFKLGFVGHVSQQMRDVILNAWWFTAFLPLGVIFGVFFSLDVWLWAFNRARPLSGESFTRGFEPFEELFARLKKGPGDGEDADAEGTFWVSALILAPFMVVAVPATVFAGLWVGAHLRWPIALALAIPSSIALFLVLGFLGDLWGGRRTGGFVTLAAAVGVVLCMGYYPALANQLSPKEVFESYQHIHKPGEPLALFGVGGRTAAYYAGGEVQTLPDTQHAFEWLMEGQQDNRRRFMAVRADELPRLNQAYRVRTEPKARNLPVLDARSSQILLVASSLEGDKNENPLEKILLETPPKPQHVLNANMDDKLLVLGYDMLDANGHYTQVVAPGRKYHMRTYYKVLAPVTTEWEAFIHIDGYRRRHNGDHKVLEGRYPFALWLKDDIVADDYEFSLEPNFTPGTYTVFFGLFVGDTRLKVVSGPNDGDNRINGGPLRVQ